MLLCFQGLRVQTQATVSTQTTLRISSTQAAELLITQPVAFGLAWALEAYWDICLADRGQRGIHMECWRCDVFYVQFVSYGCL